MLSRVDLVERLVLLELGVEEHQLLHHVLEDLRRHSAELFVEQVTAAAAAVVVRIIYRNAPIKVDASACKLACVLVVIPPIPGGGLHLPLISVLSVLVPGPEVVTNIRVKVKTTEHFLLLLFWHNYIFVHQGGVRKHKRKSN